ncbi:MAG: NAD(P)H-dependent glycerol-3-phosphate dehydrogenase [Bacilli bacterium]
MKVTILGAGAYALALSKAIYENTKDITIWSAVSDEVALLNKERCNKNVLDYKLPEEIKITDNLKEAVKNSDVIVIAVACKFISSVCHNLKKYIKDQHLVVASKGIEQGSCLFVSQIVKKIIKTRKIAVVSGPSFAKDLISDMPTGLALGTKYKPTERMVKNVFQSKYLNVIATNDILGIEICGSIKNVIAIASGMLNGMGATDSTKAMFLTDSLHDVKSLIKNLGGNDRTILSYAGFGDILLTCTSTNSRNYTLGDMIGKGIKKEEIDKYMQSTTIEGLYTLNSIYDLINKKKVKMPIIDLIYSIIYEGNDPHSILTHLTKR